MGRKKLVACRRGHDIAVVGRYDGKRDGYGPCKACNLINAADSRLRRMTFLRLFKLQAGCAKCGYNKYPAALDFHHTDPSMKDFSIAQRPYAPMAELMSEIAKCVVICRNCHAEEHYK